ncbi:mevalonate kinase family protein [Chondromyces crocatus]|uniref:phosphomevalonate kinase n=1 Tax=Chondromyces crocatus TaxID=52 RepID=A0A0K1EH34_CHOCO|nr:hypothetical protein [Chondromyces crocatus]AKT39908.1 phosphomevalonate kinase [Chondromyces crocatus]
MIARAPGKLVLSGAYVVLEGAPSLVAAVDRYVIADTRRVGERLTEEVQAAQELGMLERVPWFDASALRAAVPGGGSRKLGLGSSAAILVASLAAARAARGEALEQGSLFDAALWAHRVAQGGGSGLDVAASVFGGVMRCTLRLGVPAAGGPGPRVEVAPHALPEGVVFTVLSSASEARTSAMLAQVRAFAAVDPAGHRSLLGEVARGAEAAIEARSVRALVEALERQARAFEVLGERAGAPIVTPAVRALRPVAAAEGAVALPSGAGGGDVTLLVGEEAPSRALLARAIELGLSPEPMRVGARGVQLDDGG